ncbi:class I SAM-dependent methyltransferase [Paenibacillus lemnae]|nr:class I SAM-dependent methyltransferase [Paenibacillus lemnae]
MTSPAFIPEGNRVSNIDRFSGFQDLYDRYRPEAPGKVIDILTGYLGAKPRLVVDLGCGTGLSTFAWKEHAGRIIGMEPNEDMRGLAEQKRQMKPDAGHISFQSGYSNETGLPSGCTDIITCSQSFHWMEPSSSLREAARILREGGIFAAYDCDWPPSLHAGIEQAYHGLIQQAEDVLDQHVEEQDQARKWNKNEHLKNIQKCGLFHFAKEIVFHNMESCTADRYAGLAISQGGIQSVLRLGLSDLDAAIHDFRQQVEAYFGLEEKQVMFSYRMRIGIK